MSLLTSVAATKGAGGLFSYLAKVTVCTVNGSAQRDRTMNRERGGKRKSNKRKRARTKEYHEKIKCCRASERRKRE